MLDHCITIIQALEQMDASANNLSSLIFNTVGANTNNFMMILALVTVFFSPLTFISGYFGMNFARFDAISENSDAFFWLVAIPSVAVFMFAVSGNMMITWVKNRWARLKITRMREKRFRARRAALGKERARVRLKGALDKRMNSMDEVDGVKMNGGSRNGFNGLGFNEVGRSETI